MLAHLCLVHGWAILGHLDRFRRRRHFAATPAGTKGGYNNFVFKIVKSFAFTSRLTQLGNI
jgi:hypothetical protein